MLSPDPVTQAPENGQNYNRYSYAFNNPLKYSDPSGFEATGSDKKKAKIKSKEYDAKAGSEFLANENLLEEILVFGVYISRSDYSNVTFDDSLSSVTGDRTSDRGGGGGNPVANSSTIDTLDKGQCNFSNEGAECKAIVPPRAEVASCISVCISTRYGSLYDLADALDPFAYGSVILNEANEELEYRLLKEGLNDLHEDGKYKSGVRKMKTLKQAAKITKGLGILGAAGFGFKWGALGYCAYQCEKEKE